ncbi:MAG: DUF1045 domain-containing protein [Candidatus Hodarchaeota archaeon]
MLSNSEQRKMRLILFWVFVCAFCILIVGTVLMLFLGLGTMTDTERSLLVKIFVGEIGFAVIVLFYSLFGLRKSKEVLQSTEPIKSSFFLKTYPRSQHPEFFSEVERLVPKAREITLIATGLNLIWEKHIVDLLISRARSGEVRVTICMGNPFSPHVQDRLIEEEMRGTRPPVGRDGIERNVKALVQRIHEIGNPNGISVCLFEHYPTFATLIFDQDIFVYPYAYIILGNVSPIFHLLNDGSEEARFFISNAERIVRDAVPAEDVVSSRLSRKHYSKDWIAAAVYIIPDEDEPLYQFGSSVLGYDVRNQKSLERTLESILDVRPYVGEAVQYGFHATLGDALFFATQAEIDRVMAELRMLAEDFPAFTLSNFRITDNFHSEQELVILCDDESGVSEALHHELVSRVYSVAISSIYLAGKTRKKIVSTSYDRANLMMKRYGSPYILEEFKLHFTLCAAAPTDADLRKDILKRLRSAYNKKVGNKDLQVDEICLLIKSDSDETWRIHASYLLSGKI